MNRRGGRANQLRDHRRAVAQPAAGFPDLPGLRPTPDRVRETLFNWLAPMLPGARCLDCSPAAARSASRRCRAARPRWCSSNATRLAVRALRENLARLQRRRRAGERQRHWPGYASRERRSRSCCSIRRSDRIAGTGLRGAGTGRLAGGEPPGSIWKPKRINPRRCPPMDAVPGKNRWNGLLPGAAGE
jgi:hypothetical protein